MDSGEWPAWIAGGAAVISTCAAGLSVWQALAARIQTKVAKTQAAEAKRSADAAHR